MVGLPIRHHFVQIKNRLIVTETDLIKQRNVAPKLFSNEDLVVAPHCNDEVGTFDRLFIGLRDLVGNAKLDDALSRLG